MKRTLSYVIIFGLLSFCIEARAGLLLGGGVNITTAFTNTPPIQTNTIIVQVPQITVGQNAISGTNSYYGTVQFSIDGTNYLNLGPVWIPASTSAGSTPIPTVPVTVPVMFRFCATTNVANTGLINLSVSSP